MNDRPVTAEETLRALIGQLEAALVTARTLLLAITPAPEPETPRPVVMGQPDDPEDDGSLTVG